MNWKRRRRPSVDPRRLNRRGARPLVETMESRPLLSTTGAGEIMAPALSAIMPDRGGFGTSGGSGGITNPTPASSAITPAELSKAYSLSQSSTSGSGTTIAIVDAYNDPNIQADLATFDATYSLPTANLTVENQNGQTTNLPATDAGWSLEIALDVEMAHAAAPGAKIVLVEANSTSISDLMTAVQTAAKSANVVSMSWGGSEFLGEKAYDTPAYFANPNVTFVAASGDDGGASGAEFPASSPYVVSVGGTTLSLSSSGGYGSETAWNASGSRRSGYSGSAGGVSTVESLPSYQAAALGSTYAAGRTTPDVSLNANPNTGVSVYDSVSGLGQTGWFQVGGTSAGTPVWAGLVAAADQARAANHLGPLSSTQTLNLLYGLYGTTASPASTYATSFHDVTTGSNFVAAATKGFDMVTGLGSPVGSSVVAAASTFGATTSATKAATTTTSTTTSTSTTHTTTHDQPVSSTSTSSSSSTATATAATAMINATVTVTLPVGPVAITTATTSSGTTQTPAGSALTATISTNSISPGLPAQPFSQLARVPFLMTSDKGPVLPPISGSSNPSQPGLFLDPVESQQIGEVAPVLATLPMPPISVWDAAVARFFAEDGGTMTPHLPPSEEPATVELEPTPVDTAALAGLAVAIWGTWEYRSRRSDRDRNRERVHRLRSPFRTVSAV
jgi:hypothetical protein